MAGSTTTSGLRRPTRLASITPSPIWCAGLARNSKASIGRSDANNISSEITMITAYDRTVLRASWTIPRLEEQDAKPHQNRHGPEALGETTALLVVDRLSQSHDRLLRLIPNIRLRRLELSHAV